MGRVERDFVGGEAVLPTETGMREVPVGSLAALQGDEAVRQLAREQAAVQPLIGLLELLVGFLGGFDSAIQDGGLIAGMCTTILAGFPCGEVCNAHDNRNPGGCDVARSKGNCQDQSSRFPRGQSEI